MFQLDHRFKGPIYEQIVEKIKALIITGTLKGDEQLPSVRELSTQLTTNPNTVQKAYRTLERDGFIYAVRGKGNFVMPSEEIPGHQAKIDTLLHDLYQLIDELLFLGITKKSLWHSLQQYLQMKGEPYAKD